MKLTALFERNIVNQDEIKRVLGELTQRATQDNVRKWINSTFRKWLINKYENVSPYQAKEDDPEWAKNADELYQIQVRDNDLSTWSHWIDFLNTLPDHKSINMNPDQVKEKVAEWDEQLKNQEATEQEKAAALKGTEVVKKYDDGFYWANLTSKQALEYEGKAMSHCVGSYAEQINTGNTLILSLRDPKGQPHITIEVDKSNKSINQIKGFANQGIKEKYQSYAKDLIENGVKGIEFEEVEDLINVGIIVVDGTWHNMYELPEGLKVDDDLMMDDTSVKQLPEDLQVGGSLFLNNTSIKQLPEDLQVGGSLFLNHTPIKQLPEGLKVGRDLFLHNTPIEQLPEGLKVGRDLFLHNTPIEQLPEDLQVDGKIKGFEKNESYKPDFKTFLAENK